MDKTKHRLALEVVAEWTEALMRSGFDREEALRGLLVLVEMGLLSSIHEAAREYRAEIEGVVRSQLGEMTDCK